MKKWTSLSVLILLFSLYLGGAVLLAPCRVPEGVPLSSSSSRATARQVERLQLRVSELKEALEVARARARHYRKALARIRHRLGGALVYPYSGPLTLRGLTVLSLARGFVGQTWYVWGGSSHSGTDCSGLVMHVYGEVGIRLPHGATAQQRLSHYIPLSRARPGDLVFWGSSSYSYHVAIYAGGGRVIEAAHSGSTVGYGTTAGAWCAGTLLW